MWDSTTGEFLYSFSDFTSPVSHFSFSPDGNLFATMLEDGRCIVIEFKTRKIVTIFNPEINQVNAIVFSPDGLNIAIATITSTVNIFNTLSGEKILTLYGHSGTIHDISYSNNHCLRIGFSGYLDLVEAQIIMRVLFGMT